MKIKFTRDYSPRKKGEIFEARNRDEVRTAEWYLANGIAELCKCSQAPNGCPDCEEKSKAKEVDLSKLRIIDLEPIAEKLGIEVPEGTKKAGIIALIKTAQAEQENN
jgi:hypothetical protein